MFWLFWQRTSQHKTPKSHNNNGIQCPPKKLLVIITKTRNDEGAYHTIFLATFFFLRKNHRIRHCEQHELLLSTNQTMPLCISAALLLLRLHCYAPLAGATLTGRSSTRRRYSPLRSPYTSYSTTGCEVQKNWTTAGGTKIGVSSWVYLFFSHLQTKSIKISIRFFCFVTFRNSSFNCQK